MFGKATLTVSTILLMGASLTGFAQLAAQTTTTPQPKEKQPPRVVFDIPKDNLSDTTPAIARPTLYDPTPEQIRDQALLGAIKEKVTKGHAARASGDPETALEHYQSALAQLEETLLGIDSYDIRFGIGMVAPAIADIYAELGDDRSDATQSRVNLWYKCGLLANTEQPIPRFDPTLCGDSLNFDLFRATGA